MGREILRIPGLCILLNDDGKVAFYTQIGEAGMVIYIDAQYLRAVRAAIDVVIHDNEKRAREIKKFRRRTCRQA